MQPSSLQYSSFLKEGGSKAGSSHFNEKNLILIGHHCRYLGYFFLIMLFELWCHPRSGGTDKQLLQSAHKEWSGQDPNSKSSQKPYAVVQLGTQHSDPGLATYTDFFRLLCLGKNLLVMLFWKVALHGLV